MLNCSSTMRYVVIMVPSCNREPIDCSVSGMGGECSTWGIGEVRIEFRRGYLRQRDHLEGPDIDGRIILK